MIASAARLKGLEVTLNDLATGLRSRALVEQQELHSANGVIALNNMPGYARDWPGDLLSLVRIV